MATQVISQADNTTFLRRVLQADGAFEAICGIGLIVGAQPISKEFGIDAAPALIVLGAGFLAVSIWLFWLAAQLTLSKGTALIIAVVNAVSALAMVDIILFNWLPLSTEGKWIFGIVALLLADLAIFEFYGLRKAK